MSSITSFLFLRIFFKPVCSCVSDEDGECVGENYDKDATVPYAFESHFEQNDVDCRASSGAENDEEIASKILSHKYIPAVNIL